MRFAGVEVGHSTIIRGQGTRGLITASVHATEEAILNAMLAAETLTGIKS